MEDQVDHESLIVQLRTAFLQQNLGEQLFDGNPLKTSFPCPEVLNIFPLFCLCVRVISNLNIK